ncbi:hypothetical protein ATS72_000205 [Pseudoalteromonas sp. 13-15]|jgi:hypothetical protein|uniref:hypothetical protein n=1 Tax=Pseudoalteromonas TaxID=53246 RepID=UPI00057B3692|nr:MULTISPECIES: hypothetical protein [Pseudoalteromonas]ATG58855.1 hypothetical protein CPA52_11770 [Pseudoalteromonas marina]AUL72137.1 hypothetical protein ATS72_000205 [Pseudoalteromonas sp. 13-15]MCK8119947.1 hypothetical protein [Pseudoalteromonas sp. 2CM32C]WFO19780.1 hypothetical protein ATS73_002915 [Pseudoalteromonas sp. H100]SIN72561.1 hypothetical protein SAMN05878071_0040 [Pseudoalteromonas marina]
MQANTDKLAELLDAMEVALKNSNQIEAQDYLNEIDQLLRSLTKEDLAAEEQSFTLLNKRLIEISIVYTSHRDDMKKQLFQFKSNSKKLSAYSK